MIGADEVDLYLPDHRAVIEVQSSLHANPAARKHDAEKRERVEALGLRWFELW
jgi:very-short-patch-repair endonuclease